MALPFLNRKSISSVIISKRGKPDLEAAPEVEAPESEMDPGLRSACEDILRAIESKSPMDLAKALQYAVDCMGPHSDEDSES